MSNPSIPSNSILPLDPSEQELTAALARRPELRLPEGFAARVSAQAAALPPVRQRHSISYGRLTAGVCAALLLVAMFVLAAQVKASFTSLAFDVELVLLVQLLGIAWWLSSSPQDV